MSYIYCSVVIGDYYVGGSLLSMEEEKTQLILALGYPLFYSFSAVEEEKIGNSHLVRINFLCSFRNRLFDSLHILRSRWCLLAPQAPNEKKMKPIHEIRDIHMLGFTEPPHLYFSFEWVISTDLR